MVNFLPRNHRCLCHLGLSVTVGAATGFTSHTLLVQRSSEVFSHVVFYISQWASHYKHVSKEKSVPFSMSVDNAEISWTLHSVPYVETYSKKLSVLSVHKVLKLYLDLLLEHATMWKNLTGFDPLAWKSHLHLTDNQHFDSRSFTCISFPPLLFIVLNFLLFCLNSEGIFCWNR